MICPSCNKEWDSTTDCSCGARWVGAPPVDAVFPVPKLGYGITALVVVIGALAVQLAVTIRNVYLSDLTWPWALYLITGSLSKFILPVALLATLLAWRGLRLSTRKPGEYGGNGLTRLGLVSSLILCFINGGTLLARLPDMLENRRLKQLAYTEAMMYKLNTAIARYREQYGSYPERLIDLQEMDPTLRPVLDYWDHPLVYTPRSPEVASRVTPVPFQNYELISRGSDGILGTADDIVMRDGHIISGQPTEGEQKRPADSLNK